MEDRRYLLVSLVLAFVGSFAGHCQTATARYKHLIGPKLRARSLPAQQGEAAIAVAVLNQMIPAAKPVSVRVA